MRTEQETLTCFGNKTTDCHTKRKHASQQEMVSRRSVEMHFVSRGYCVLCVRAQCVNAQCMSAQCMNARCPFGSGREGGTRWGVQRFLLKWLRYRPEHDVKLLIKRWELYVVGS